MLVCVYVRVCLNMNVTCLVLRTHTTMCTLLTISLITEKLLPNDCTVNPYQGFQNVSVISYLCLIVCLTPTLQSYSDIVTKSKLISIVRYRISRGKVIQFYDLMQFWFAFSDWRQMSFQIGLLLPATEIFQECCSEWAGDREVGIYSETRPGSYSKWFNKVL